MKRKVTVIAIIAIIFSIIFSITVSANTNDIKNAAAAKVNIVVNDIALPLAQKMQEKFGIPYVYFNKFVIPEKVLQELLKMVQML